MKECFDAFTNRFKETIHPVPSAAGLPKYYSAAFDSINRPTRKTAIKESTTHVIRDTASMFT